jgi:hypothetical protein
MDGGSGLSSGMSGWSEDCRGVGPNDQALEGGRRADGEFFFGDPGDRFVAGDWGVIDGRETPGLFRPSDVTFFFRHTLTQGTADSQFTWTGADTDLIPVAGDFNLN